MTPEARKTDAISKFPAPKNVSKLRSFLGLVNKLGIFVPDLAHSTTELCALLKKNVVYVWLREQQVAFDKTKEILLANLLIRPFDRLIPTKLLTDASRTVFGTECLDTWVHTAPFPSLC